MLDSWCGGGVAEKLARSEEYRRQKDESDGIGRELKRKKDCGVKILLKNSNKNFVEGILFSVEGILLRKICCKNFAIKFARPHKVMRGRAN